MGIGTFFHHIGTFCLLAATVLLLIADISAPVINHISLLRVNFEDSQQGSFSFGTFGYCRLDIDGGNDFCTKKMIGYNPAQHLRAVDSNIDISTAGEDTSKALTRVMVLHPIATGTAFIAFLLAIGTHTILSFLASIISAITFILTVVVLACDFAAFSIIKGDVNDTNNHAKYGAAIWCVLGAAIATLISTVLVFVTCCAGRRKNRGVHGDKGFVDGPAPARRRRFGIF